MSTRSALWRGMRRAVAWWWQDVRPSTGADLRGSGVARPAHETGRAPRPQERWRPQSEPTGAWEHVDPHAATVWPSRAALVAVGVWAGLVALRVRNLAESVR